MKVTGAIAAIIVRTGRRILCCRSEVKRGQELSVLSTLEIKRTSRQWRALSLSPSRLVGRPTLHKGASQHLGELSQPKKKAGALNNDSNML